MHNTDKKISKELSVTTFAIAKLEERQLYGEQYKNIQYWNDKQFKNKPSLSCILGE